MICNSRFIFVHVPKTGGQSVTKALGGRARHLHLHTPLRCIDKRHRFAFGFIRSPWERMVSLYRFLCQKNFRRESDNYDQDAVRAAGFKRWLMEDEFIMMEDIRGQAAHACWSMPDGSPVVPMQRRPQMWWLQGCDYIGRFDNLEDDFAAVCELLGRKPVPKLPHINSTVGEDWWREYDDESIDFVTEHFTPDIQYRASMGCESLPF